MNGTYVGVALQCYTISDVMHKEPLPFTVQDGAQGELNHNSKPASADVAEIKVL